MFKEFFKNLINTIKTPKNILLITLGVFWIILYVYLRLFRDLSGYKIIDKKPSVNIIIILFLLLVVIMHFITLSAIFFSWYREKYNKTQNFLITLTVEKISLVKDTVFLAPLNLIYGLMEKDIPGSGRFFLWLEKHITICANKEIGHHIVHLTILLFDVLPKILLATVFFVDVVVFAQIQFFIQLLPLFFIPQLFKLLRRLMNSFANNNIPVICNCFTSITPLGAGLSVYDGAFTVHKSFLAVPAPGYEKIVGKDDIHHLQKKKQR